VEAIWSALIAVAGTLLGSVSTFVTIVSSPARR
jgi:hypothetical protein